jgi:AcrR family transcriptional regulator
VRLGVKGVSAQQPEGLLIFDKSEGTVRFSQVKPPRKSSKAGNTAPKKPPLPIGQRSVPLQARSRARFDAIVDAAALLFADHGYEAVTMDAIAKKAGTPIGSVYQYFADKRAVFGAISYRSAVRGKEAFELLVPPLLIGKGGKLPPFGATLDAIIDGFALLSSSDPAIRAVNRNVGHAGAHLEDEMAVHRLLIQKSAELLERYAPTSTPKVRELVATMLVDSVTSAFVLGELRTASEARRQLEELKHMVRLYAMDRLGIG